VDEAKDLVDLANKICPTCGMTLEGEHPTLEYAGKKIHVCGDHCKEAFMKDPEKHLATLTKGKLTK
jgi:YHS domain-containing protein